MIAVTRTPSRLETEDYEDYHFAKNKPLTKQNFSFKEKKQESFFFIRSVGFFIKYSIKKLPNPPGQRLLAGSFDNTMKW